MLLAEQSAFLAIAEIGAKIAGFARVMALKSLKKRRFMVIIS